MDDFAVLDDSMVSADGLFVYSHALILYGELPLVLTFHGNNQEIYTHEEKIFQFVGEQMYDGCRLYACNHYLRYRSVWDLVFQEVNGVRLPRAVRNLFSEAHNVAKSRARKRLDELLDNQK